MPNVTILQVTRTLKLDLLKNTSGPEVEKLKKKFQKLLKEKDLDIIVQCNLKITNFLDITLNQWFIPPLQKTQRRNELYSRHHQSLKKFYDQLKKTFNFVIIKKYFSRVGHLLSKMLKEQWI